MRQVSDDILASYAIRMGDNCLILGQRISVWCGHAPSLEEDIALANTGLDLIGQTKNWFELACARDTTLGTPDRLTYLRDERDFTNCLLVEQPDQDYAYTLVRQFLFDAWHYLILDALIGSNETAIRDVAAKSIKEVRYHRTRSTDLITRLGGGSADSHEKMQAALDGLWRFSGELTTPDAFDEACFAAGFAPDLTQIATAYIDLSLIHI